MAGLVPAIHALLDLTQSKTWMPGTKPGMTVERPLRMNWKLLSSRQV
jgi:hypothetical protein